MSRTLSAHGSESGVRRRAQGGIAAVYEEVFGRGNLEAADELMVPACVSHGPGSPPLVGTDQIKGQATLLRTAMPDLQVILNDQLGADDRVVCRWTGRVTHSGPLALPSGIVAGTGREVVFDEIRIDRFSSGRIVESWFILDRMALWQQARSAVRAGFHRRLDVDLLAVNGSAVGVEGQCSVALGSVTTGG